jgi:hypothetical protein
VDGFSPQDIAITTRQVLHQRWPILLVIHDADDGAWQFVNGHGDTDDTDSALVVGIESVSAVDPTILELSDLPMGWRAWRASVDGDWRREPR